VPDADLFQAIKSGKASVVTDEIDRFTGKGILLKSGKELEADIIITATGFNLCVMGDIAFTVDNKPLDFAETVTYRGMMFTGVPNLAWESLKHRMGLAVNAPYRIHEMAADTLGVLDALGIAQAHVVGVSMGGMIAQRVALAAPQRVLSLTSIMSSSGARYLPGPKAHVLKALLSRPQGRGEHAIVDHYIRLFKVIGSPAFPLDEAALRERILLATRRSFHPAGTVRQMTAIAADTRRADELARVKSPTLVLHGKDDPLVPFACGQDTARRIAGSRLVGIEGMGHDLPPGVVERLLEPLVPHLRAS
jgi:pimeloyl-ACP methyl ester carboxylesterase